MRTQYHTHIECYHACPIPASSSFRRNGCFCVFVLIIFCRKRKNTPLPIYSSSQFVVFSPNSYVFNSEFILNNIAVEQGEPILTPKTRPLSWHKQTVFMHEQIHQMWWWKRRRKNCFEMKFNHVRVPNRWVYCKYIKISNGNIYKSQFMIRLWCLFRFDIYDILSAICREKKKSNFCRRMKIFVVE